MRGEGEERGLEEAEAKTSLNTGRGLRTWRERSYGQCKDLKERSQ